ncbi:hypothetical protein T484DRAFT_1973508 [Baffinella frigidus]|nr:hypothetical protein T484DRAFT_1973508 [Cryptophyta sp. CCMP2293]|mmetsp:Transcript_28342/g.67707  ORF Transcript_28342/g.67707 Transcript_28342/m.67707 type:complete len:117 (-) Transcript_28342:36-386(-)
MASGFSKKSMTDLYRNVLKLHRRVLPQEMRDLGDKYARNEFKAHKTAKIGQVKEFARQWKEYVFAIDQQSKQGKFGQDLDPQRALAMTQEQRESLDRLETEVRRGGEEEEPPKTMG